MVVKYNGKDYGVCRNSCYLKIKWQRESAIFYKTHTNPIFVLIFWLRAEETMSFILVFIGFTFFLKRQTWKIDLHTSCCYFITFSNQRTERPRESGLNCFCFWLLLTICWWSQYSKLHTLLLYWLKTLISH